MKSLMALAYAFLLFCGFEPATLSCWGLYDTSTQQTEKNNSVVIQIAQNEAIVSNEDSHAKTEYTTPLAAREFFNKKKEINVIKEQYALQASIAKANDINTQTSSPTSMTETINPEQSTADHYDDIDFYDTHQEPVTKSNNINKQSSSPTTVTEAFNSEQPLFDHEDDITFYDTQSGGYSDTEVHKIIAQHKPVATITTDEGDTIDFRPRDPQTNSVDTTYYNGLKSLNTAKQNILKLTETDQYTGASPELDQQLLKNSEDITATQQLINNLKSQASVIESDAAFTDPIEYNGNNRQKMMDNQASLKNIQVKLETLNKQNIQLMTARKTAYEKQFIAHNNVETSVSTTPIKSVPTMNKSMFTSPFNIKTNIAHPYNRIGNIIKASEPFMKSNFTSQQAPKDTVYNNTSSLIEID